MSTRTLKDASPLIVLDNSVLSAYTRLNKLDLIYGLFKKVFIPLGVYEEYTQRWDVETLPKWITILRLYENEYKEASSLSLGKGEAQAIILAKRLDCLLGLDDLVARETAKRRGLNIIGSIGILRIAYESCILESKENLRNLLDELAEDLHIENWLYTWALNAEKPN